MIQLGTYKPEGGWWCALCYPDAGEQGEWFCNVTDGKGRSSSFICDKHKHLTLGELVEQLNKRQDEMDKPAKFEFIRSDGGSLSDGWRLAE
jgi:hypothetical protein